MKALGFGDGGRVGFVKLTGCEDQRIGLPAVTLFGVDRPEMALLVPAAGGDRLSALDELLDALLAGDLVHVVVDLLLRRAQPRPVAALGEGERVEMAGDVAGGPWVAVVEPRPAQVGRLLEDRDVGDPVPAQLDGGGDPAEAGADDQDAQFAPSWGLWSRGCDRHATPSLNVA